MSHPLVKSVAVASAVGALAGLIAAPRVAHAQQTSIRDSYVTVPIGTTPDRANGQYLNNSSLASQGTGATATTIPGFLNTTGGTATSQFSTTTGGLAYSAPFVNNLPAAGAAGSGKVTYTNAPLDNAVRSTGRNLVGSVVANVIPSSGSYWFSMLLNRGPVPAAGAVDRDYVMAGFGNPNAPTLGASNVAGLYLGFSGNAGNVAFRYRDTSNGGNGVVVEQTIVNASTNNINNTTLLVVARIDVNVSGFTDNVTYWVNPTDARDEAGLSASPFVTGTFSGNLLSAPSDITRLGWFSRNYNSNAFFDEVRLSRTLPGLALQAPEPGAFALFAPGVIALGGVLRRRRRAA